MATTKLGRLSLVGKCGRTPIFIGWDEKGAPGVSRFLSADAQKDFESAQASGASFPSFQTENIRCFEFSTLGKGIDYPGSVEDVIPVNVRDENGELRTLNLGEGAILKGIEWALFASRNEDHAWNSIIGMDLINDGSGVSSTIPIYTVMFQDSRVENGALCALLFRPIISGASNESSVFRFAKAVIKQLLVIDESQPPKGRKGYIMMAARATKGGYKTGLADVILDMNDQATQEAVGKFKASGLKLLRTLGIAEVSDELIKEVSDPLPNYNVDSLDRKGLCDLASAMKDITPYRNRS